MCVCVFVAEVVLKFHSSIVTTDITFNIVWLMAKKGNISMLVMDCCFNHIIQRAILG